MKLHTEFFKPIIAKSDKSIFVRYDYGFDFLFHYFIQSFIPLLTIVIQTTSIFFHTLVYNNASGITELT